MDTEIDKELVADIARLMVAEAAPAELPTFRAVSRAYFADPARSLAGGGSGRGLLKFGATDIALLLTPVALAAANEVADYLLGEAIRPAVVRGGATVRRLFGARGAATEPAEAPVKLTTEQWAEVHRIVVDVACRYGLKPDLAEVMGDAVVGAGHRPHPTESQ